MSAAAPLVALAGIGPARAAALARLGVGDVRELLLLVPRRLEVQPDVVPARAARGAVDAEVAVAGRVRAVRFHRAGRRRSLVRARLDDAGGDGAIDLLFFNQPWQRERLSALARDGARVVAAGRVVATRSGPALAAPRVGTPDAPLPPPGALRPVYPTAAGISQGVLRAALERALAEHADAVREPLAAADLARLGLPALPAAVAELHAPDTFAGFLAARRRALLEPVLGLQARLFERRAGGPAGRARPVPTPADPEELFAPLGLAPTAAQARCLGEVLADLGRARPMRRLLQGDVGAGKTAVAVAALLAVARAGGQGALLAPTELLAEQHHARVAGALAAEGVRVELVTGSLPAARRRRAEAALADGAAALAVGTHALLSGGVRFARLDLAVIDEQQRFGVAQRRALADKGADAHVLSMTATPIPRTLAMTVYGDLAVSLLDERPPGRGAVETLVLGPDDRARVTRGLARRLARGERAFWVAPRIEPDDAGGGEDDPASAEDAHRRLSRALGEHGVELVHGRLEPAERAARIARFRDGASRLLVGTTVVEVGVDVPEATVLVVEGAERLGLAQLHQLRGRIGRGARASTCVLLVEDEGSPGAERARALAATDDGFAIAEEDLRRRGMGELAGVRQAGRAGDLIGAGEPEAEAELLLFARDAVRDDGVRAHYLALEATRAEAAAT